MAAVPAALGADAEGPVVRADRRDGRGRDDVAARDARRRAQLGLPLLVDPRLHVHALGPLHARLRLGGQRLLLLHRRRRGRRRGPAGHVRRSAASASSTSRTLDHLDGYENARPVRIGNGAYTHRQHDVWGTILDSFYLHTKSRDGLPDRFWPILAEPGRAGDRRTGASPTAGSGRCAASPSTSPRRRSCAGSRATAARGWRGCARTTSRPTRWQAVADEIHADVLRATASTSAACSSSTTTPTALDASLLLAPLVRFLPPDDERIVATVNAIADELTVDGLVLRYRVEETDDGLSRRGGHVRDLLVLAGQRAGRDRRDAPGARAVREAPRLRQPARPVRRGDRPAVRPAPRQLPAGVHAPRARSTRSCTSSAPTTQLALSAQPLDARRREHAARRWRRPTRSRSRDPRDRPARRRGGGAPRGRRSWPTTSTTRASGAADVHIALAGGSTPQRAYELLADDAGHVGARAPVARRRALRARRPRGRQPADGRREPVSKRPRAEPAARCTRVRGELGPEDAAWLYGREIVARDRRASRCSTSSCSAWARTATPRRCSPATPRLARRDAPVIAGARLAQAAARADHADAAGPRARALHAAARDRRRQARGAGRRARPATIALPAARMGDGLDEIVCDERRRADG